VNTPKCRWPGYLVGIVVALLVLISARQSAAIPVTSNPLWTNTGITVLATDTVSFTGAAAAWTFGVGVPLFGPAGTFLASGGPEEWVTDLQHGELIGFIGGSGLNLNASPRVIGQNDSGLFAIGAGPFTETGRAGALWLGFNDDFASGAISDNVGSGSVDVDVSAPAGPSAAPEPATLLLFGTTLVGLGAVVRRRMRGAAKRTV
jgi:PEP-CTERM motif-containing protein